MTRQQRIRQNEALRNRYEKAFYAPLKRALSKQLSSFTSDLQRFGIDQALTNIDDQLWIKDLASVIRQMYISAGLAKANQTLGELRRLPKVQKKRSSFGFNEQWTQDIIVLPNEPIQQGCTADQ
jgi:hypothetical protein